MALAMEAEQTRQLLDRVGTLEAVAATLPRKDPRRAQLLRVVQAELAGAAPVRPVVAAEILQLTEKTVREWAAEGVLLVSQERPRLLLDADRLHQGEPLGHRPPHGRQNPRAARRGVPPARRRRADPP
jgi:hypothetical protein